jgi:hypothetical protein
LVETVGFAASPVASGIEGSVMVVIILVAVGVSVKLAGLILAGMSLYIIYGVTSDVGSVNCRSIFVGL